MDISDLASSEQEGLRRIIAYAIARWDWESPTLFGIEKLQAEVVLREWPASLQRSPAKAAAAIWGPLGFFIHGGGMRDHECLAQFGLSQKDCAALLNKIRERVDVALQQAE